VTGQLPSALVYCPCSVGDTPVPGTGQELDKVLDEARRTLANTTVPSHVPCHSRAGADPCPGQIYVKVLPETGKVYWHCPVCEDSGTLQLR
jgi:hypothetical protein